MIRGLVIGAVVTGLVGCASSPPQTSAPAVSAGTVNSDTSAVSSDPTASSGELHVIEVPKVAQTAEVAPQQGTPHGDELVCRREKTTGSHMVTRICRTRAQIEQERRDAQALASGVKGSVINTPQGVSPRMDRGTPQLPGHNNN